jgi:hypothetical protein
VEQLAEAAEHGTKIIVYGNKGESDEMGVPRTNPALEELIKNGKAVFVDANLLEVAHYPEFTNNNIDLIKRLAGKLTLQTETFGKDIQVGAMEKSADEKFIFIINWSGVKAPLVLNLNLPDKGKYNVDAYFMTTGLSKMKNENGDSEFSAEQLKKFRLDLDLNAAAILRIHPVNTK